MRELFTSCACDFCDGLADVHWHRGFVVFRGDDDFSRPVCVFPTQFDAAVYRRANGWQLSPLREVRFEIPVPWDRPFTLHRDHRFEPQPYHCYLVAPLQIQNERNLDRWNDGYEMGTK
jgi:hypothetical protein